MDPPEGVDGGEELLAAGGDRPSRWAPRPEDGQLPRWLLLARRTVIILAALIVVAVGVRAVSQPRRATKPTSAPPSGAVAAVPPRAIQPGPLDDVRALAETPGKLTDYVRVDTPAGTCLPVKPNSSPVGAVLRAERAQLGAVRLLDSGRTIDQATGLCELTVRSKLGDAVVTVSITPKARAGHRTAFDHLETGAATLAGLTVLYGQMISRDGWKVVVGATGPRQRNLPGSQQLLALAQAREMLW